jgi:hypothetical protein
MHVLESSDSMSLVEGGQVDRRIYLPLRRQWGGYERQVIPLFFLLFSPGPNDAMCITGLGVPVAAGGCMGGWILVTLQLVWRCCQLSGHAAN